MKFYIAVIYISAYLFTCRYLFTRTNLSKREKHLYTEILLEKQSIIINMCKLLKQKCSFSCFDKIIYCIFNGGSKM